MGPADYTAGPLLGCVAFGASTAIPYTAVDDVNFTCPSLISKLVILAVHSALIPARYPRRSASKMSSGNVVGPTVASTSLWDAFWQVRFGCFDAKTHEF